ncbi:MAG: type II secretion system F family protein, partial [Hungatella sp.]
MANYAYRVITAAGKEKKGSMEADTPEKVRSVLKAEGFLLLDIKEQGVLSRDIDLKLGKKVTSRDMSIFCRQFISIVNAGVSIIDALEMLEEQTENQMLKAAVEGTRIGIQKGGTLSDAMRAESHV